VLLEDVIYNLSTNSDHYKNATLSFVVGEMQHKQLFELLRHTNVIWDHRQLSEASSSHCYPSRLQSLVGIVRN